MVADLDRAVAIEPNSFDNWLSAGQIMFQVDPLAAVEYFNHAIKLADDDIQVLAYRAIAYATAGQLDRGLTDLDAALRLRPDDPTVLGIKGNLLMHLDRLDEAIESFSKSISIQPVAQVLFDRAFCNQKAGKIEESIADYTSAYRLDDTLIDAICERGQVYQKSGNFDLAVRDFEQCRKVRPDDPQAALQLAWILATCPVEAVRDGERALMIVGDHCDPVTCQQTEPLNALAAAYAELGDFEKARILQRCAVALSHFSPDFHEISTRRLNTITNSSPIREADIPLVVLNRFANQTPREITLDEAMSVPPDILGLSYLEVHTLLEMCSLAKAGARIVAYTLATCPDETVRNGKRAVAAALTAKKLSDDETNPEMFAALAVAHAEAGDFEAAINYQKQVIKNVDGFLKSFHEERLRLFESKRPFHEDPGF